MAIAPHPGRIAITGAAGFIGRHVRETLAARGFDVLRIVRKADAIAPDRTIVADMRDENDWASILSGCRAVVHLAGATGRQRTSFSNFHDINEMGTSRLAEGARRASVSTFIHASTVAAGTDAGMDRGGTYASSKARAEAHVSGFGGGERGAINLRLPLVYAVDAPGKWQQLQRLAASPFPLPFASIENRRGVLAVDNLCNAVLAILDGPTATSGTFDLSDGADVSTAQLVSWLRLGMGRSSRMFPLPASLLRVFLLPALGRSGVDGLVGDFPLSNEEFSTAFKWQPCQSTDEAVMKCGSDYAALRAIRR